MEEYIYKLNSNIMSNKKKSIITFEAKINEIKTILLQFKAVTCIPLLTINFSI